MYAAVNNASNNKTWRRMQIYHAVFAAQQMNILLILLASHSTY
jgi:hypothetical protein